MHFIQSRPEQEVQGYDTINRFLANPSSSFAEEDVSKFAMACKAATLLDRANSLGISWATGSAFRLNIGRLTFAHRFRFVLSNLALNDETKTDLTMKIAAMRHAIQAFKDTISPLTVGANIQDPLVVIHAMILFASIRLDTSPAWSKHSVESALAAVALVDDTSFEYMGHVNPILGFLLSAIGQVLVDELMRIRGSVSNLKEDAELEAKMKNAADRLSVVLRACAAESPYICE